jgi:hypothetical protein
MAVVSKNPESLLVKICTKYRYFNIVTEWNHYFWN